MNNVLKVFPHLDVPLPQRKINGTPSQRSLFIFSTASAYVAVQEPSGTVRSSKYPNLASPSPTGSPVYWPNITSSNFNGLMNLNTFTCKYRNKYSNSTGCVAESGYQ